MQPQPEKEPVKDAAVSSTVITRPAKTAETANPMPKLEAICDWCRDARADIYCDIKPICFDCIEAIIEREIAIEIVKEARGRTRGILFQSELPPLWEK